MTEQHDKRSREFKVEVALLCLVMFELGYLFCTFIETFQV